MFEKVNPKQNFPEMEKNIMNFWKENKIFEKSVDNNEAKPSYSFFDGPPFATGLPHYGHVVANLMKDVVPRFWTMKGYKVERRWGWDCHGLPIENLIEKEHNIKNKQDIEKWGVDKFNEACHASVLRYADEWKKFIPRIGRWVDMENDYRTMDWKYTESIWWVFSELYKKGLVYEGHKAMHLCPRCETTLSNFEVTLGYKEITDLSATVKFKLNPSQKIGDFTTDDNTYILAWTTTPWTLIGNVALAVNSSIKYIVLSIKGESEKYILAKDRVNEILKSKKFDILGEIEGENLIGLSHKPIFDYYVGKDLRNEENGWKIYAADFVNTNEGTGIVHIAPAFGEDDMKLEQKYNLPFIQHVGMDGIIKKEAKDFAGLSVKPKSNEKDSHQKTDIEIIKYLAHHNYLFAKEKYVHSYPHCWRCDTPLINYATKSWFVKVTEIKEKMISNNREIRWIPEYIKDGRFGKWLEDARDWAVSRSRFWGAPLPIWKCGKCGDLEVISSIDELREKSSEKITKLIFVRHGESENNVKNIKAGQINIYPLTKKGIEQSEEVAKLSQKEEIDLIISSPISRAKQTAEIISKELGIEYVEDARIKEFNFGSWNGYSSKDLIREKNEVYLEYKKLSYDEKKYNYKFGGDGESRKEVEERVRKFIEEISDKYIGKNILIISHGGINAMFYRVINNASIKDTYKYEFRLGNAERNVFYVDKNGKEFNLHKPKIDDVEIKCSKCGERSRIIGDVFDCWFESGSMPYAQWHYPFENVDKFEKSFPADFIAEGIDQTRGWFYTLIVLSTALFEKPAFKNVIANGIVLAEDGQKMSKRLKNYPEPNLLIEKYGADALRYYLLTSPVMKGENLNFSEKGVDEVLKRFMIILWNSYSFFVMNVNLLPENNISEIKTSKGKEKSNNLLDMWILSELNILKKEVGKQMENYDLVKASRPLREFIDKLSNWYIRRSRKRFSSDNGKDKMFAFETLHKVLVEYSKIMAPFMPFLAEEIYKNLTGEESVHLESFPKVEQESINEELNTEMNFARQIVTSGLAIRAKNSVKVRMPLAKLKVESEKFKVKNKELFEIIKEELNIKNIEIAEKIEEEKGWAIEEGSGVKVALNLEITDELRLEGAAREIVRHIQTMRKEAKYNRNDLISVAYNFEGNEINISDIFDGQSEYIKKECLAKNISFNKELNPDNFDLIKELKIEDKKIKIGIVKNEK